MSQLIFLLEEPPAKASRSRECERDSLIRAVLSCSSMVQSLHAIAPPGWFGKTSPVSCQTTKDKALEAFWASSAAKASSHRQTVGRTAESSRPARQMPMASPTQCLTLSTSVWRNGARVCSLSDILETGAHLSRYYLSPKACAGILRRAAKRNKELPEQLRVALEAVAATLTTTSPTSHERSPPTPPALTGEGFDASEDGTGRGTPLVPVAYGIDSDCFDRSGEGSAADAGSRSGLGIQAELSSVVRAKRPNAVAYNNMTGALDTMTDPNSHIVQTQWAVRRLTPLECERLQGAPDDHTNIAYRGRNTIADGPRYKMIGNSWAVPVVRWIGERIDLVRSEMDRAA